MADERTTGEGTQPRRFLMDPSLFGTDPAALWRPLEPDDHAPEQIAAYWQHLAVCTLREMFPTQLVDELSSRLGKDNVVYLRRQVAGEYRISVEDLIGWALAFDDVTLLPQFDGLGDLHPPQATG